MKFLVVGNKGKLGSRIFEIASTKHNVVGIDKEQNISKFYHTKFDAIIDVSTPENSMTTLEFATKNKIPLVIGCTGHSSAQTQKILSAKNTIPIMLCYNFSVGITALKMALNQVLRFKISDAYISEIHHKNKKDKPSGTAKMLEQILSKSHTHLHKTTSIRQNNFIGSHTVDLFLEDEHISLSHTAESRDCFARGAVFSLEQIATKSPGIYDLEDLINSQ